MADIIVTVFFGNCRYGSVGDVHEPKSKDRRMERMALTVFSVARGVLESALGRVILSLFGTVFTTERTTIGLVFWRRNS